MADLRSIEEIYPHTVQLKHKGDCIPLSLRVVNWLEARKIMNIVDFHLDMNYDEERIQLRFKKKKPAKIFKAAKKLVRDAK